MKLSTFLLLLDGKAWFPSVTSLRAGDPLESALGDQFYELLWRRFIREQGEAAAFEWLSSRREWPEGLPEINAGPIHSQVYGQCVADDVASLRAAWCWFKSDIESAAMWTVYGHQGVAVRTDRESLSAALPPQKEFCIDSMVYVDRRAAAESNIARLLLADPDLILRPYFLKAIEYQHEKEVRVAAHCPAGAKGLMIAGINPAILIREVCISPLLPPSEASAIEGIVRSKLGATSPQVGRSSLNFMSIGALFAESITEKRYSTSDENIEKDILPPSFRRL